MNVIKFSEITLNRKVKDALKEEDIGKVEVKEEEEMEIEDSIIIIIIIIFVIRLIVVDEDKKEVKYDNEEK
jgi:hypothetical protein